MNDNTKARKMSDRPAWFTPTGQIPFRLTEEYLTACPIGTVLSVPAGFPKAGNRETIMLSVEKVSDRKWRVQTRRGFDALHLVGLSARHRQRRDDVVR